MATTSTSKGTEGKVGLETKDSLVSKVERLPFSGRMKHAALIGRDNKDSPQLKQLITSLRDHGAPEAPSMKVEEEFIKILPPQQANVAKYLDEEQLAMQAAVSSRSLDVMEAEMKTPSVHFKRLAIREIVKLEKDDEKLYDYVVNSVPAFRKKFIHYLIDARKTSVLERAFPVLEKEHGLDVVADFVHGCSTEFLTEQLKRKEIRVCKAIHWTKIARYNGPVILERIRRKLKHKIENRHRYNLAKVWNTWWNRLGEKVVRTELLRNGRNSALVLEIATTSPIYVYIGTRVPEPKFSDCKPEETALTLPVFISENLAHFVRRHTAEMLDFLKRTIYLAKNTYSHPKSFYLTGLYGTFWDCKDFKQLRSKAFAFLLAIVQHLLAKSTPSSFYYPDSHTSLDHRCLSSSWISHQFLSNFSHGQLTVLVREWTGYLDRMRPTADAYASWKDMDDTMTIGKCITRWQDTVRGVYRGILAEMKARESKLDQHERTLDGATFVARTKRAVSARGRRRVQRNVAVPVASSAGPKKRCRFKTDEQVKATKKLIAHKREKHSEYRRQVFAQYVELLTSPKWDFSKEKPKSKKTVLDRHRIEAGNFSQVFSYVSDEEQCIGLFFDKLLPFWAKGQDFEDTYQRHGGSWISYYRNIGLQMLTNLEMIEKDLRKSQKSRDVAKELKIKVFDRLIEFFGTDPITYVDDIVNYMTHATPDQRVKTFALWTHDNLAHLGRIHSHNLDTLFNLVIGGRTGSSEAKEGNTDLTSVWAVVAKLLTDDELSQDIRDKLLAYQDVSDHGVRKSLSKTADSNSTDQRNASYETLLKATVLSKSVVQMKRTLQHVRTKLKNESAANRGSALSLLITELSDDSEHNKKAELMFAEECQELWFGLLNDALESPDLSEDASILESFKELSREAIRRSAGNTSGKLFNFGVELQWVMSKFKLGERKNLAEFRIDMPSGLKAGVSNKFFPAGSEKQLVAGVVKAYKDRIGEKVPDFLSDVTFLEPLYGIVGRQWQYIEELQGHVRQIIEEVKKSPVDKEGLFVIEKDNDLVRVFETLFKLEGGDRGEWHKIPVLAELLDILLHSRQARRVVFHYVWKNSGTKRREKKKAREGCVLKLLAITKSAIYLRFVWRFLVRYRQDLLDEFLNAGKTFRGVFFLEPDQRGPLAKDDTARETWWQTLCDIDVAEHMKEEEEKEKEIEEERQRWEEEHKEDKAVLGIEYDHEDLFCLPACFGLDRLLPRQVAKLAQQRKNQIFNVNLGLAQRVKSTQLWTIMPTVDYNDIVRFYEKHDKGEHKLSVNIIEAALKGVMQIDEPCAPLQFLLSPKFLSSDRARIATYCIVKCVPFMPSDQMTKTLIVVLTGDRRKGLKVTAYKEIIRLLASRPTEKHLQMLLHEWKREVLHRDVRIAILQKALGFLKKDAEDKVAWEILNSGTENKNVEILVAMLGVRPEEVRSMTTPSRVCLKPRMQEHFEALNKCFVPSKSGERYAREVVLKLSKSCPDEDIRYLAMSILFVWRQYKELLVDFAEQLYIGVTDVRPEVINCPRVDIQQIHNNRYSACLQGFLMVCGLTVNESDENKEKRQELGVKAMNTLCHTLKALAIDEREMKHNLLARVQQFANSIMYNASDYYFSKEIEKALIVRPLSGLDGAFWVFLANRRVSRYGNSVSSSKMIRFIQKRLLPELIRHPLREEAILQMVQNMYQAYSYRSVRDPGFELLDSFLNDTVTKDKGVLDSQVYQSFRRKVLLRCLARDESGDYATIERKAGLLKFFAEVGAFAGRRKQRRTGVEREAANLQTFLISATNRTKTYRSGDKHGQSLGKTAKALINYVVTTAVTTYSQTDIGTVEGAFFMPFAIELAENHADMVVAGAKDKICKFIDQLVNHHARNPTASTQQATSQLVVSLIRAIEKRNVELLSTADRKVKGPLKRINDALHPAALQTLEVFLTGSLSKSTRLVFGRNKKHAGKQESGPSEFKYAAAFDNMLMEVQMSVLHSFSAFVVQRSDAFKMWLHRAIVHASGFIEDTADLTLMSAKNKLKGIIEQAYRSPTTLVTVQGDDEATKAKNEKNAKRVTEAAKHVLGLIKSLVGLSLVSKSKAKSEGKKNGAFLLSIYRHLCMTLGLDLVTHFGQHTAIPKPVEIEEEDEEEGDEKGKERMEVEGEEEKESKKKAAAKKPKKKKRAVTEMVWRSEFEEVLDQLSADKDETISSVALYVVTRFWN